MRCHAVTASLEKTETEENENKTEKEVWSRHMGCRQGVN